jgi:hypothetical protein
MIVVTSCSDTSEHLVTLLACLVAAQTTFSTGLLESTYALNVPT